MKALTPLFVCVTLWALSSCSPKVTSNVIHRVNPQEYLDDVVLIKENEPLPADAQWMGSIEVKGSANYDKMAEMTRTRAWTDGAKYVKISDFKTDGVRSDIHIMNSNLYWADTTEPNPDDVKVIDRNGNVVSTYNTTGGQPQIPENVSPLSKLGPNELRVFGGYGRRLNKIDPSLDLFAKQHNKRLMNGEVIGMEYIQYFDQSRGSSGLGLRFQLMHASSADVVTVSYDNGLTFTQGILDETVNISYIGPVYAARALSRNGKHLFEDYVGLGVLFWYDNGTINSDYITLRGKTLGLTTGFNYSYFLSRNVTLGAEVSFTSGVIRKVTATDGKETVTQELDKEHYEGLANLGVCAQIVYTF